MQADCLFCKIAAGTIPATIVDRTETTLAFNDIAPVAPIHVLVTPVKHIAKVDAHADPQELGNLVAHAAALGAKLAPNGYRLVINTGAEGGQTLDHLHVHILGGRFLGWPPG